MVRSSSLADLARIPISRSYHARIKSEKITATLAVLVNLSTVFIITLTYSNAATFSRLPSSCLGFTDNFADSYPCSTDTSFVPTLPKGLATEPSGFCGPWLEIYVFISSEPNPCRMSFEVWWYF